MASRLRVPTLAIAALSMALCLATIGTAGRSLYVYNHHHMTNPWLLPLWPHHFDRRELPMLIGTAGATFVLNATLAVALLLSSVRTLHPSTLHTRLTDFVASRQFHRARNIVTEHFGNDRGNLLLSRSQQSITTQRNPANLDVSLD